MTLHETIDSPAIGAQSAPSFHDLMASIGYLLFQWSLLDRSLDEEIAQLRRESGDMLMRSTRARTLNERLAEWRALLSRGPRRNAHHVAVEGVGESILDFQRLRNLVATGLVTASTDDVQPTIRCVHQASRLGAADQVRMTVADILGAIDQMEACRSEMALLRGLIRH